MRFPETGAERAWTAALVVAAAVLLVGSLAFPDLVYGGFVWHYFWGPVYADAHGASCAVWNGGAPTLRYTAAECAASHGIVARPGYTLVSGVGYAVASAFALAGVVFWLRRLDIGEDFGLLYALVPFVLFDGALRVVADTDTRVSYSLVRYPVSALLVSPLVHFTVFLLALCALLVAVWLARTGRASGYERPLFAIGTGLFCAALAYLLVLAVVDTDVQFHPGFAALTLAVAGAVTFADYWLLTNHAPHVLAGVGFAGVLVIFGQSIEGASNVLGLDFGKQLGLGYDLYPGHPANRFVIDLTSQFLPHWLTHVTGNAWPFLLVKVVAATAVVSVFDRRMYAENPRFTVLLLFCVLAVGLGPGTRDVLRATFGV